MRTEIKTKLIEEPEYPCFKKHKIMNCIVLFSSPQVGTMVHRGNASCEVGHHARDGWDIEYYEPWFGTLTVSP